MALLQQLGSTRCLRVVPLPQKPSRLDVEPFTKDFADVLGEAQDGRLILA